MIAIGSGAAASYDGGGLPSTTAPIVIGTDALANADEAYQTIAIGENAMQWGSGQNTRLSIALGHYALRNSGNTVSAFANTAIGHNAGENMDGNNNVLMGYQTGQGLFSRYAGDYNTIIGSQNGLTLSGPNNYNTILGGDAGGTLISGDSNILIGYQADVPFSSQSNYVNIGNVFYGSMGTGELYIGGNGALRLPVGDNTTRPGTLADTTAVNGMIRYNSTSGRFEGYQSDSWQDILTGSAIAGLNDLTDTNISSVASGQILSYDGSQWVNVNANSAGLWSSAGGDSIFYNSGTPSVGIGTATPAVELDVTGDINLTGMLMMGQIAGDAPTYLSSGSVVAALNDLTDVDTAGVNDGEVLMYSAGSGNWIAGSGGGGGGAINDLSDAWTDYSTDYNMFMGSGAGASVASGGQNNLGIGQSALPALTTGDNNVAIGRNTLTQITNPTGNVAIGANAGRLYQMTEFAIPSVFIGNNAGEQATNTFNSGLVAIGSNALAYTGGGNVDGTTAIGAAALENMGQNGGSTGNVALGNVAGIYMRAGTGNVLVGSNVARGAGPPYNHTGDNNVIIGRNAARELDGSNNNNVIIGQGTALTLDEGDNNILLGNAVDVPTATTSNYMNIANVIYGSGMYNAGAHIGINNSTPNAALDVTGDIEYTGTLTDVSDMRLKKDIAPLDANEIIGRLSQIDTYSFRMINDEKGQLELGVMAQEVEKVFPELVRTANDEMGTKSVNYVGFIAPLIEASKELKSENDALRAEITEMKLAQAEFKDDIMREVNGLKAHTGYGIDKAQIGLWTIALLFGFSSIFFMVGGILRHRQHKQG